MGQPRTGEWGLEGASLGRQRRAQLTATAVDQRGVFDRGGELGVLGAPAALVEGDCAVIEALGRAMVVARHRDAGEVGAG